MAPKLKTEAPAEAIIKTEVPAEGMKGFSLPANLANVKLPTLQGSANFLQWMLKLQYHLSKIGGDAFEGIIPAHCVGQEPKVPQVCCPL